MIAILRNHGIIYTCKKSVQFKLWDLIFLCRNMKKVLGILVSSWKSLKSFRKDKIKLEKTNFYLVLFRIKKY